MRCSRQRIVGAIGSSASEPSWLAWIALTAGTFLFAQGFGLGGVIGTYG
jgi:hypothetical protein